MQQTKLTVVMQKLANPSRASDHIAWNRSIASNLRELMLLPSQMKNLLGKFLMNLLNTMVNLLGKLKLLNYALPSQLKNLLVYRNLFHECVLKSRYNSCALNQRLKF
jgi:hypothetical protein